MIQRAALFLCLFLVSCTENINTPEYVRNELITISTLKDSELTYYVDRPDTTKQYPIVLTIDGSTCRGWETTGFGEFLSPDETAPMPYARVFVSKPGVQAGDNGTTCTEEFLKNYTIDQRVTDHLRALQHLRASAEWWDGRLYIWGWSDGGSIGSRLTAYYPNVDRAVLGGMGGGTTMFEQFRDIFICPETPESPAEIRESCIADITKKFERMTDNPTWKQSWAGEENTYRVWASRINSRASNILTDTDQPILIVHGAEDLESVPVTSARVLIDDLKTDGHDTLTYWEISGMAHSIKSLPADRQRALETAMRDWMLLGDHIDQPQ